MTEVNTAVTQADLERWYKMQEELSELKTAESLLRKRIFAHYFPNPKEGTNDFALGDGYVVKGGRVVNRKVLESEVEAYKERAKQEGSNLPKFNFAKLIKYKPELVKSEYNKLTDEQRHAFDQVLEIKDGSPTLDVVKPKRG